MRKTATFVFLLLVSVPMFSQPGDFLDFMPDYMHEAGAGYASGMEPENAVFSDAGLRYPFGRLGLVVQAGGLFNQDSAMFHLYLGPMLCIVSNPEWRLLLDLGLDLMAGRSYWVGFGTSVSAHRSLSENLYVGVNLGVVYAFNHMYREETGQYTYEFDSNTGGSNEVPVTENRNHSVNRFLFKPSIVLGLQF